MELLNLVLSPQRTGVKIIAEFEHDDLKVLMKKLGELQNKCLEYKMTIHWDDAEGVTTIQTKNWHKCDC